MSEAKAKPASRGIFRLFRKKGPSREEQLAALRTANDRLEATLAQERRDAGERLTAEQQRLNNQIEFLQSKVVQKEAEIKRLGAVIAQLAMTEPPTAPPTAPPTDEPVDSWDTLPETDAPVVIDQFAELDAPAPPIAPPKPVTRPPRPPTTSGSAGAGFDSMAISEGIDPKERELLLQHSGFDPATLELIAQLESEQATQPKTKLFECGACYDTFQSDMIFSGMHCDHTKAIEAAEKEGEETIPAICLVCMHTHCTTMVKENDLDITCPVDDCEGKLTYEEVVRTIQDLKMREKYQNFLNKGRIEQFKDLSPCPNKKCGILVPRKDDTGMVVCINPDCKMEFCFKCHEEWHTGATCEEYKEWKMRHPGEDVTFLIWVQKNGAKDCPYCGVPCQKISGCNRVSCGKCKKAFCWLCQAKIGAGYGHFRGGRCDTYAATRR